MKKENDEEIEINVKDIKKIYIFYYVFSTITKRWYYVWFTKFERGPYGWNF